MNLYFDRLSQMCTLETLDEAIFLGPPTQSILKLKTEYGLTSGQASKAVVQAVYNGGYAVDLDMIKKIAIVAGDEYSKNKEA